MFEQSKTKTAPLAENNRFIQPEEILRLIGLKEGMAAGHFGCGNGYFTFAAARLLGEMGQVFAIDVQRAVLEQIQKEARIESLPNIHTVWSDLEILGATGIPPGALDIIFVVNVLYQIKARHSMFSEAKRLLKPKGQILIIDWKKDSRDRFGPPQDSRVGLEDVRKLALEIGFVEKQTFEAGKFHYGALLEKK